MSNVVASLDAAVPPPSAGVLLTPASAIPMIPIRWLWPGWLAQGKMHLLAGSPGQGKTTIAMAFAAAVSSGGAWPDGTPCARGSALVWTAEDDPGDTLNPRLVGMGADLARVHYLQGTRTDDGKERAFDPAVDMPMLLAAVKTIGDVRLIVVDPIVTAVTGDSHRNAEVRQGLQPLVTLADKLGAAVLGITHLAKASGGRDPTERVIGSIAFAAVARVVLLASKIKGEDGEDKRVLVRSKSNIGPDDGGFQYHVEQVQVQDGLDASIVTWGETVSGTARELLAEAESEPDGEGGAVASAAEFLRELLTGGTMPSKQVKADAIEAGFAWRTIRRAADDLGVVRKKGGMDAGWYWRLPPEGVQEKTKLSNKKVWTTSGNLDTFGDSDPVPTPPAAVLSGETETPSPPSLFDLTPDGGALI